MNNSLYLMYVLPGNGSRSWGVLGGSDVPDPYGMPKYLYRKYEFDRKNFLKVLKILGEYKDKIVELGILPSQENQDIIFPTQEELNGWKKEKKKVIERVERLLENN